MFCSKVETFDGSVQISRYDAEGLRHEIEESGQLVQFIFSGREVVVEKTENDTLRLVRGYDITASQSEQAKTYYHYVSDEQGSTTHIYENQEIRNYYEYDAFGKLITCEEKIHNRFKYTGQQFDPITQQYYLRARYYNPIIARFTQEDTYKGDGLNLYAYCANNPVTYFDPSGFAAKAICSVKYAELQAKKEAHEKDPTNPGLSRNEQKQYDRHEKDHINGNEKKKNKYEKDIKKADDKQKEREQKNIKKQQEKQQRYNDNVSELTRQYENQGYTPEQAKQRAIADQAARNVNMNGQSPAQLGANKGYDGIGTTANGGADFSGTDYIYRDSSGKEATVTIKMTGSREADFTAANAKAGLPEKPNGYTWHHVDDYNPVTGECTIQLVETNVHSATTKHAGSCAQYQAVNGVNYRS